MADSVRKKKLYLIPVPLSSETRPDEVLPRNVLETVKAIRCFFVEELRSARRFLKAVDRDFDIDNTEFYIVNEHTKDTAATDICQILGKNDKVGVISEAGCPSVADPGAMVVDIARTGGYDIVPMIGPSSILLGLMASGFNGQEFAFNGYLPHDSGQRKKKILQLAGKVSSGNQTQIFIETPYRNNKLITEIAGLLPAEMNLCVACNLTAPDEEVIVRSASEWRGADFDFSKRPAIFLIGR